MEELSASEVRRLAVRAQGLYGPRPRGAGAALLQVGALQLDTVSVLARSHELVCQARSGPLSRAAIEDACWGLDGSGYARAFEYWGHAASIMPVTSWPLWEFRRRARAHRQHAQGTGSAEAALQAAVLDRLRDEGPLTAQQLGGAKQGGEWWDWSPVKLAVERLLSRGEVVCATRSGWKRVYDLPERVIPPRLLNDIRSEAEQLSSLVTQAGCRLGVATVADLADYWRLLNAQVTSALPGSGLIQIRVRGWKQPAWADPEALASLSRTGRHRTTLLSPFDSLIWDRARTERVFGFYHRLELYVPQAKRIHGYYAMPVLAGGQIVGRVDPKRQGKTLVAKQVSVIPGEAEGAGAAAKSQQKALLAVADALRSAATWVGSEAIAVGRITPERLRAPLVELVS